MDAGQVFVTPKTARDAIQGEEDLLPLPALVVEELLEIAGGLMQIQNKRMLGDHGTTLRDGVEGVRITEARPTPKNPTTPADSHLRPPSGRTI
jgi:hypothetical protein